MFTLVPLSRSVKRFLYRLILSLAILAGLVGFLVIAIWPRRTSKINERFETQNSVFKIRVTANAEGGLGFVAGAYYVFESARVDSSRWREVMIYRHDDPVPIPRDHVRFLSENIAYLFMGNMYAITTDAGQTWSIWKAPDEIFRGGKYYGYRYPNDIEVSVDGKGRMTIEPMEARSGPSHYLCTTDYGRSWRLCGER